MRAWFLVALLPLASAAEWVQVGELLQVRPDNSIVPTGVVATLDGVAQAASAAAAAGVKAEIASDTAAAMSNLLGDVIGIVNSLEGVGYVRGYVLEFGSGGVEENTNTTAVIVEFVPNVSNDATYVYSDVYTFFNESPEGFPVCRWATSAGRTNEWEVAESVDIVLTDRLVGDTYYEEVYRNTVRVGIEYASAFFRVFAEAVASQTGAFLPVQNGISPGNREPLMAVFASGTNEIHFVGGIRVTPD